MRLGGTLMFLDHKPTDQQPSDDTETNQTQNSGGNLVSKGRCKDIKVAVCSLSLGATSEQQSRPAVEELRREIESAVERFYFTGSPPGVLQEHYIDCLVVLNPCLVIDDLVYSRLRDPNDEDVLFWICRMLGRRSFSRTTLRHILNSIVYVDTEGSDECTLLKYRILAQIVRQYSIGDQMIQARDMAPASLMKVEELRDGKLLASRTAPTTAGEGLPAPTLADVKRYNMIEPYLVDKDLGSDNANVLANIIWEASIEFLDAPTDASAYEAECILEMLAAVIASTGKFFQNRVGKRIEVFKSLTGLKAFKPFVDAISGNFENSDVIVPRLVGDTN